MSTPERSLSDGRFLVACAAGLLAMAALSLVFTFAGQPDTAAGALVGGGAVLVVAVLARWRARRRGPSVDDGGFTRTILGTADERDKAILTSSLAWVGLTAFLANAIGLAALALGADASAVIGAIETLLIAVLVGAFILLSRRT